MSVSAPSAPIERKEVHVIIDPSSPKKDHISPTLNKMLKVIANILIILGFSLILGGSVFFGVGAAVGGGAAVAGISAMTIATAPGTISLGIATILAACKILVFSEKGINSSKDLTAKDLILIN